MGIKVLVVLSVERREKRHLSGGKKIVQFRPRGRRSTAMVDLNFEGESGQTDRQGDRQTEYLLTLSQ
jgi:hypothetical protein